MMYYYLCASLPSLVFGEVPALRLTEFDAICREELAPNEYGRLTSGGLRLRRGESGTGLPQLYADYTRFEQYLRTRIAQRRVARDEEKTLTLPDPEEYFTEIDTLLGQISGSDPAERERSIDQLRWRRIEDLEAGHDFDFDQLCAYRLKLEILEKYRERKADVGREHFEEAVGRISGEENQNSTVGS